MQYHALSLSKLPGTLVYIIGYPGSDPLPALSTASNVTFRFVDKQPGWVQCLPRAASLPIRVVYQMMVLLYILLFALPSPKAILVQNPPAIPTLAVCWAASRWHRSALVVDWHNFGYTIMALTSGRKLVALARNFERYWGRAANKSFCVTKAMQSELARWSISAEVLYDRPPSIFQPLAMEEKHRVLQRLAPQLSSSIVGTATPFWLQSSLAVPGCSLVAKEYADHRVVSRSSRPAIVISSTSWTEDEDFSVLLSAAQAYESAALRDSAAYPDLVVIVTGKGPQRQMYLDKISSLSLRKVAFISAWLEPADYPLLLACADLGVCLHTSSSGLDLPMKVLDMFGVGIPVSAISYSCITELVKPGVNGLLFSSAAELGEQLLGLFRGFPNSPAAGLCGLQKGVLSEQDTRWESMWESTARPILC